MNATEVVIDILGDKVIYDPEEIENLQEESEVYILSGTWRYDNVSCFVGFDNPRSGSIGLRNLKGTEPEDLAEAAHESYHAILHMQGIDDFGPNEEQRINKLAAEWLKRHLEGPELIAALLHLETSDKSYPPAS